MRQAFDGFRARSQPYRVLSLAAWFLLIFAAVEIAFGIFGLAAGDAALGERALGTASLAWIGCASCFWAKARYK